MQSTTSTATVNHKKKGNSLAAETSLQIPTAAPHKARVLKLHYDHEDHPSELDVSAAIMRTAAVCVGLVCSDELAWKHPLVNLRLPRLDPSACEW